MTANRVVYLLGACTVAGLLLAAPAAAVDGVIEINQARALAGGVTPGDTMAGFPVTISVPGSYRLTGLLFSANLTFPAIEITTSDVTIDLNGSTIFGSATCTGSPPTSCTAGAAAGITASGNRVTVINGAVRAFPNRGLSLSGTGNRVEGVRVEGNGEAGIVTGDGSIVSGVIARGNFGNGIWTGTASVVRDCTVQGNGAASAILVGAGSLVRNCSSQGNAGHGIRTTGDATVLGNTVSGNTLYGLNLASGTGYGGNVLSSNTSGNVTGLGRELSPNLCNGSQCLFPPGVLCQRDCFGEVQRVFMAGPGGTCPALPSFVLPCAPYRCDVLQTSCRTSCASNSDCASGASCTGGACIPRPPGTLCTRNCSDEVQRIFVTGFDGACDLSAPFLVTPCAPFGCDDAGVTCRASCSSTSDCAAGSACNVATGTCVVPGASCKDAFTVLTPDGAELSCSPYVCVGGVCREHCDSIGHCRAGFSCNLATRACV